MSENVENVFFHATLEKFGNATITGHFECVFQENSGREEGFSKRSVFKMFPVHTKTPAAVFSII